LRENIYYTLGEREQAGLRHYYELAATHRIVDVLRPVTFYRR
jgi:hypothetical protein